MLNLRLHHLSKISQSVDADNLLKNSQNYSLMKSKLPPKHYNHPSPLVGNIGGGGGGYGASAINSTTNRKDYSNNLMSRANEIDMATKLQEERVSLIILHSQHMNNILKMHDKQIKKGMSTLQRGKK
jgi:hypothetical protein